MIFLEMAKRNIRLHWLRSALAVLGIVIGVVSISSMGVLGNGLVLFISDQLSTVGDSVIVTPNAAGGEGGGGLAGASGLKLTDRQLEEIRRAAIPNRVIPIYSTADRLKIGSENVTGTVYGVAQDDIPILLEIESGSYLRGAGACLVGSTLAEEKHLRVGSRLVIGGEETLRVSGILKERGTGFDINPDSGIVVLDKWYEQRYNVTDHDYAIVKVKDISTIDGVVKAIDHRLNKKDKVVNVIDTKRILETITDSFQRISLFTLIIGGISLVVAGVSILNVMMMAVTERIKEIGIMRAIGARRAEVRRMFLYEAILLGMVGSTIGGIMSLFGGLLVSLVMLNTTKYVFLPSSLLYIPFGMAFGIGTCLLSGLYPAWKASNLNPIEALRHE